jgi:hypothetical protein
LSSFIVGHGGLSPASVLPVHQTEEEHHSTIHVVISGPGSKQHTDSHVLITAIHHDKNAPD